MDNDAWVECENCGVELPEEETADNGLCLYCDAQ